MHVVNIDLAKAEGSIDHGGEVRCGQRLKVGSVGGKGRPHESSIGSRERKKCDWPGRKETLVRSSRHKGGEGFRKADRCHNTVAIIIPATRSDGGE